MIMYDLFPGQRRFGFNLSFFYDNKMGFEELQPKRRQDIFVYESQPSSELISFMVIVENACCVRETEP